MRCVNGALHHFVDPDYCSHCGASNEEFGMAKQFISATSAKCPESPYGDTHHLRPRAVGMVCEYCRKTQSEIESELNKGE